jgi:hypothetical protein
MDTNELTMMKKSMALLAAVVCLFCFCCQDGKDSADPEGKIMSDNGIISVSTTLVCGWFPNYDSITLTPSKGFHLNHCMKDKQGVTFTLRDSDWQALMATIDLEKFNNFTSNSCALCVDGCDMSIGITTTQGYHRVKFAANDDNPPAEVHDLAIYLTALRKELQEKNCK